MYANARGVRTKLTSLKIILEEQRPDIMAITETNLKPEQRITVPNYIGVFKPRHSKQGGGLAFLIRKEIAHLVSTVTPENKVDTQSSWLSLNYNKKVFLGVFYGRHESDPKSTIITDFGQLTEEIQAHKSQQGEILLVGDFNSKLQVRNVQEQSRNGEVMTAMIQATNLNVLNSSNICEGTWTRVASATQKSIIDYALCSENLTPHIQSMTIDDTGHYKLVGKKPSDHNTIIITLDGLKEKSTPAPPRFKWRINTKTEWKQFEAAFKRKWEPVPKDDTTQELYTNWEDAIITSAHTEIGTRKIQSVWKNPTNRLIKEAQKEKRQAKLEFNKSIKSRADPYEFNSARDKYLQAKGHLREAVENLITINLEKSLQEVTTTGGVNSKRFWSLRRNLRKANTEDLSCLRDNNGSYIHEQEELLSYVAEYFETLYSLRTDQRFDPGWTNYVESLIEENVKNKSFEDLPINRPISDKEIDAVLKQLPNDKAEGRDRIPYEFIKLGGNAINQSFKAITHSIFQSETIPTSWNQLQTISLPKGKKNPEYLENKRGITLASNAEKVFERVIVNRVALVLPFTEAQAGARKGRSTGDQIFTLKATLTHRIQNGQPIYLAFLDIKQAYDSVWKAAVMLNLWQKGVKGKVWRILKNLGDNLTTQIATRFGLTREIPIQESIRQGGVASGVEFASLIDQTETELQAKGLGIPIHHMRVSSLLLMDDIILLATSPQMLQNMLDTLDRVALQAHLKFSQLKSKVMVINAPSHQPLEWFLGDLQLQETDEYTYLGEVIRNDMTMKGHLAHLVRRSFAVSATMFACAAEPVLDRIKMGTLLQLYQSCWIPSVLYNAETWLISKVMIKSVTQLQLNLLRRLLKVPTSTPKVALYGELGVLPIEQEIHKRQLGYLHNLLTADKFASNILWLQISHNQPRSWWMSVNSLLLRYELPNSVTEIAAMKKEVWKRNVKRGIQKYFHNWYCRDSIAKTKMSGIYTHKQEPGRASYMESLSRNQVAIIFRLRTRMTNAKANLAIGPQICRWCRRGHETDTHIFAECRAEKIREERVKHQIDSLDPVFHNDSQNMEQLKRMANFARNVGLLPGGFLWI